MTVNNDAMAPALTYTQILEYFTSKGVKSDCASCGHDSAAIGVNPITEAAVFAAVPIAEAKQNAFGNLPRHLAVTTTCENCGFIRSFDARKILDFHKGQK